jgi:hypothetical protein
MDASSGLMETNRIDLYTLPHKALRHALASAGTALAAAGPGAVELVHEALDALASHGHHEDEFIHPLAARYLPEVEAELARQHGDLERHLVGTRRVLDGVVASGAEPVAVLRAYRAFQRLVACNLGHLDHEETHVMPALWAVVPAGELVDLMAAFRAAHPDAAALFRRWPEALSADERRMFGVAA